MGEAREGIGSSNRSNTYDIAVSVVPEGGAMFKLPDFERIIELTDILENTAANLFIIKNNNSGPMIADYQRTAAVECI